MNNDDSRLIPVDPDDMSTMSMTSLSEVKFILHALENELDRYMGNYHSLISTGLPEGHSTAVKTRTILRGMVGTTMKIVVQYSALHMADCENPTVCGIGSQTMLTETLDGFREVIAALDKVDKRAEPYDGAIGLDMLTRAFLNTNLN